MTKSIVMVVAVFLLFSALAWGVGCSFKAGPPPEKLLASFRHEGKVICLAFSPDGSYLVGGSEGTEVSTERFWHGRVKVWDVNTLNHVGSVDFTQHIATLAFPPMDAMLAVGLANTSARKKNLGFKPHPGEVRILSFPKLIEEKKFQLGSEVRQVLFSRNGKFFGASFSSPLAQFRWRGDLSVWTVPDWKQVRKIENDREGSLPFTHGPDEASFMYLTKPPINRNDSHRYRIMQIRSDREAKEDKALVTFHQDNTPSLVDSIAPFVDKSRLLYRSGYTRILDFENGNDVTPVELIQGTFNTCKGYTVSADGKWLASFGNEPRQFPSQPWIVLWDLEKNERIHGWRVSEDAMMPSSIALSHDKKFLAIGTGRLYRKDGVEQCGEVVLYDISKLLKRQ